MSTRETPITAEQFTKAVGSEPVQDDLARCNCTKAGTFGHSQCGWNDKANLPIFMCSSSPESRGYAERVAELEQEGMTTSDAQAVADAELGGAP